MEHNDAHHSLSLVPSEFSLDDEEDLSDSVLNNLSALDFSNSDVAELPDDELSALISPIRPPPTTTASTASRGASHLQKQLSPSKAGGSIRVSLQRLEDPGAPVADGGHHLVEMSSGATNLGRGELLGIDEVRCSRKQLVLHVGEKTVHLTQMGVNPSVLHRVGHEAERMRRGYQYEVHDGDRFSLLISPAIVFRIQVTGQEGEVHNSSSSHSTAIRKSASRGEDSVAMKSGEQSPHATVASTNSVRGRSSDSAPHSPHSSSKALSHSAGPRRVSPDGPDGKHLQHTPVRSTPLSGRVDSGRSTPGTPASQVDTDGSFTSAMLLSSMVNLFVPYSREAAAGEESAGGGKRKGGSESSGVSAQSSPALSRARSSKQISGISGSETSGGERILGDFHAFEKNLISSPPSTKPKVKVGSVETLKVPESSSGRRRGVESRGSGASSAASSAKTTGDEMFGTGFSEMDSEELEALQAELAEEASGLDLPTTSTFSEETSHKNKGKQLKGRARRVARDQETPPSSETDDDIHPDDDDTPHEDGPSSPKIHLARAPIEEQRRKARTVKKVMKPRAVAVSKKMGSRYDDEENKSLYVIRARPEWKGFKGTKWTLVEELPTKPQEWYTDDLVHNCCQCREEFTWVKRKHHCRVCGKIYCEVCSAFRLDLPPTFGEHAGPQRVCLRCSASYSPISDDAKSRIRKFCTERGGIETPQFVAHVMFSKGSGKGANMREPCIAVIGKYRIMIMHTTREQEIESYYFLDLKQIKSVNNDDILLNFKYVLPFRRTSQTGEKSTFIRLESPRCSNMVPHICKSFRKLGTSTELKISLTPDHTNAVSKIRIKRNTDRDAFVNLYKAASDYVGVGVNPNVACYLVSLLDNKEDTVDMDEVPTESDTSLEHCAVAVCLCYSSSFSVVKCSTYDRTTPYLAYILRYNSGIRALRLSSANPELEEIGKALRANPNSLLQRLDLSGSDLNNINTVMWLTSGLHHLSQGLQELHLSSCSLRSQAVAFIFKKGLCVNRAMLASLERLSMSDNQFAESGSKAAGTFLKDLVQLPASKLRELRFLRCNLYMKSIIAILGSVKTMSYLDISGNPMIEEDVLTFLQCQARGPAALATLGLSDCNLTVQMLSSVFSHYLKSSSRLQEGSQISLKVAHNTFSVRSLPPPAVAGAYATLSLLDISGCRLTTAQFLHVFRRLSVGDVPIRTLLLDNVLKAEKRMEERLAADELSKFILVSKSIRAVSLAGGYSGLFIESLFRRLETCQHIQEIDLRDNYLGDTIIFLLVSFISANQSVLCAHVDGNNTTEKGWRLLNSTLHSRNKTMQQLDFPWQDFALRHDVPSRPTTLPADQPWGKFYKQIEQVMQRLYINRCQISKIFHSTIDKAKVDSH